MNGFMGRVFEVLEGLDEFAGRVRCQQVRVDRFRGAAELASVNPSSFRTWDESVSRHDRRN